MTVASDAMHCTAGQCSSFNNKTCTRLRAACQDCMEARCMMPEVNSIKWLQRLGLGLLAQMTTADRLLRHTPTAEKWGSDISRPTALWPGGPCPGGTSSCCHALVSRSGSDVLAVWKGWMLTSAVYTHETSWLPRLAMTPVMAAYVHHRCHAG